MPDISGFLGTDPSAAPLPPAGGENPLTVPEYPAAEQMPEDEAAGDMGDVDPDFYALASGLFPDWPDPDFSKLQELIDMRINALGGAAPVEPDEDDLDLES
jgi:hypothetical protein